MNQRKIVDAWCGSLSTSRIDGYAPLVIPRRGRAPACKVYLGADKNTPLYAMRGIYARTVKYKPKWKE